MVEAVSCPHCSSSEVVKNGIRYVKNGRNQQYRCNACFHKFTVRHTDFKTEQDIQANVECAVSEPKNSTVKAIVLTETKQSQETAGVTKANIETIKGKILQFALYLQKEGFAESTVKRYIQSCNTLLSYGGNLLNPESIKETVAKQRWKDGTKLNYVNFYDTFTKFQRIRWERPRYVNNASLPWIPLESEIDLLIHGIHGRVSIMLQIIKETAMRIGEVTELRWMDIDTERNTITLSKPEKHGKTRMFKVSTQLIQRILKLPKRNDHVFGKSKTALAGYFSTVRKRLAREFNNPRLIRIHFHTLRHWKATMEYHRTKDIIHVMQLLGHRGIQNTLVYIHLEKTLYEDPNNQGFHVRVAHDTEESCELVKTGFEYVTGDYDDGGKIFRKPA